MPGTSRLTAFVLLGGLAYLGTPSTAAAQRTASLPSLPTGKPVARALHAALGPAESLTGVIDGIVRNDKGEPVAGVVVTAIGATTVFAVTDDQGHYELANLPPGPYLLRAHSSGYLAPRSRTIDVRASVRTASSFAIRRAEAAPTILAAGIGPVGNAAQATEAPPAAAPATGTDTSAEAGANGQPTATATPNDDHSETAWRLRHLRRGVLREVTIPGEFPAEFFDDQPEETQTIAVMLGRAVSSPARAATSFFADAPLSGQVNILTSNMFDSPDQLQSGGSMARGIAYLKLGAPVGEQGDWTVRGALTDGDLAAWIVAGNYQTRPGARHARDIGMSYSTQRYGGGNPLALREMRDGARNAGSLYAFETYTLSPAITLAYGARYERYDYLEQRNLISPRAEVTLKPFADTRVAVAVSSRADAPGAQEFQPPTDEGIWLPPQRTFSSASPGGAGVGLRAERATQVRAGLERDFGPTTIVVSAFGQHVDDQMVTLFGADVSNYPAANRGHYVVGTAGDVEARGGSVALKADLGPRFRGSVTYSNAIARMTPAASSQVDYLLLLSPSSLRPRAERLQDVTTAIEARVPETATRLLVLYRVGNGFARAGDGVASRVDSRFDVQLRQSLPFLNFTSAQWEMLIAIRNSFRDIDGDQSVYDELLTVQAPKRIIGGVALRF